MTTWANTRDPRIKKRNGVYWARFSKKGQRVEQSLETENLEVAKALVADIEAKLLVGKSWKRDRQLFEDAWIEFLSDKASGNKVRPAREKTLQEYAAFGERFYLPRFGKLRLGDIDEDVWREFVAYVQANHPGIQFFNVRKYMMGFFTWAKAHGKVLTPPYLFNPDALDEQQREEFTPGKAYTKPELKRMRTAAKERGSFYLFMCIAQYMGMRPSEITQLKRERIDLENKVIVLKKIDTKTNSGRVVPIHPKVELLLTEHLAKVRACDYVFPHAHKHLKPNAPMNKTGFKKVWAAILEAAGVEGRLYDFRHTFITHAIARGLSPSVVAKMTGTSIRIIEKYYLHFSPDDFHKEIRKFEL